MKHVLLTDAIDMYLTNMRERKEAPETTLKSTRNSLLRFARYAAEHGAVYIQEINETSHAIPYKKHLSGMADNTVKSYIMRIRGLFAFAIEQESGCNLIRSLASSPGKASANRRRSSLANN